MYGLALTFPADRSVVPVIAIAAKKSFTVKICVEASHSGPTTISETDRIRIPHPSALLFRPVTHTS